MERDISGDGEFPDHGSLLYFINESARPPLLIENIEETEIEDWSVEELKTLLSFRCNGRHQAFAVDDIQSVNDFRVMEIYNDLLAESGRKERVFRFADCELDESAYGNYIVADARSFKMLCQELAIPLMESALP